MRTDQRRFADAVNLQLQALVLRAERGLTDGVAVDVRWLRQQRAAVGDKQFLDILQTVLDADRARVRAGRRDAGSSGGRSGCRESRNNAATSGKHYTTRRLTYSHPHKFLDN
jgi:hypothetical protein